MRFPLQHLDHLLHLVFHLHLQCVHSPLYIQNDRPLLSLQNQFDFLFFFVKCFSLRYYFDVCNETILSIEF